MTDREKLAEIVEMAAHRCLPSNTEDFHLNTREDGDNDEW